MSYDQYSGSVDNNGHPHGRGSMFWEDSVRFEGKFSHGDRVGRGTLYFGDGGYLTGVYTEDTLNGVGRYVFNDETELVGMFRDGELNGLVQKYSPDGEMTFYGHYKDNIPFGNVCSYDEWGGMVCGGVDKRGDLTGSGISYVYPDQKHAITGLFKDGKLVEGKPSIVIEKDEVTKCYKCQVADKVILEPDVSTKRRLSRNPLVPDHYEQHYVCVSNSLIAGAGEGLFAKRELTPHQVISFYNGTRVSHETVDNRSWIQNSNTISLDEEVVIDLPEAFSKLDKYCASLGHKANHSDLSNSYYDKFTHPRFGRIKCIRAGREIAPHEEITVNYDYHHLNGDDEQDLPSWYSRYVKVKPDNA